VHAFLAALSERALLQSAEDGAPVEHSDTERP
jgi:hypothetical protein